MAPPSNTEDQFKFLIACIKHSTAGKIDFTQVATECDIISKGAAAKRYERLMKAHGITGNGLGGGRAGSPAASGPSTPVTPGGRKAATNPRTPASKKRKLAARGADIDEDVKTEVKAEVKHEVKHEIGDAIDANGSYTTDRNETPPEMTAGNTLVTTTPGVAYGDRADDKVHLMSAASSFFGPPAPLAFAHQMFMHPTTPESLYGFVNHFASDMTAAPTHTAVLPPTSATVLQEHDGHVHDADYTTQTSFSTSEQVASHWLHHQNPAFS